MLNPNMNSDFTFFVQGVPKLTFIAVKSGEKITFHKLCLNFITYFNVFETNNWNIVTKISTYTNLIMLNPNLDTYVKFCVQGVPQILQLNEITIFLSSDLLGICQFWDTRYTEY